MYKDAHPVWRCGDHVLSLDRPRIMGILNVTPDSFSDGGAYLAHEDAMSHAYAMLDAGADIIDVGGESTRPGFTAVRPEEEAERIIPVVRDLVEAGVIVSVDTRRAEVAKLCVRFGASIINDVTGFVDPAMVSLAKDSACGCVVMHAGEVSARVFHRKVTLDSAPRAREAMKAAADGGAAHSGEHQHAHDGKTQQDDGTENVSENKPSRDEVVSDDGSPTSFSLDAVMNRKIDYDQTTVSRAGGRHFTLPDAAPIMRRIMGFLGDQARVLVRAGIDRERICLDPGIGFGKDAGEDLVIQRATAKMASMGYPLMCAISRKRLVGSLTGVTDVSARDAGTCGMVLAAAEAGARILRVHDVEGTAQALNAYWSVAHSCVRRAFVSLGSNVGDRLGYLSRACRLLDAIPLTCVVGVSHAYETDPAYGIATPVVNCVAELRTELTPLVLLDRILTLERQLGRVRTPDLAGHGPRTIDCDLVWMDHEEHVGKRLVLPHPRIGERDYVLVPMGDLMHNPVRFLTHHGVSIAEPEHRVGHIRKDLGELNWQ